MDITLVILAAGMGSRYGGLKQLDGLGPQGQTIMDYSVHDAVAAGFTKVVFVIRRDFAEDFETKVLSKYRDKVQCEVVFQDMDAFVPEQFGSVAEARQKPWGTAHAILVAKPKVREPFAAINADDFYGNDAFVQMADQLKKGGAEYSMVGYRLANTLSDHGSVNRGICLTDNEGNLEDIFEGLKIQREGDGVVHHTSGDAEPLDENSSVSMNFWGFQPDIMDFLEEDFKRFIDETKEDPKSEYFIPFVVNDMMKKDMVSVKVIPTNSTWLGVTYQEDRPIVVNALASMSAEGVYADNF